MRHDQQITELAAEKQVSRDFIYAQKNKAMQAIDNAFTFILSQQTDFLEAWVTFNMIQFG